MVDETKLKVSVESLRNEMEIRYELALKQFYDKIKIQLADFVNKDELNNRMFEKLHKREFEKQFDRLNSTMQYLEQKVGTAIPAMRHDLDSRLKSKADNRDLAEALKEKASAEAFKVVVERLNKLEEKVRHGGVGGSSSEGNSNSDDDRDSAEGSGASDGDGEARRKERKKRKEKILKGSASTDNVQKKGSKMGLGDIVEEEEEKDSVKSNSDNKKDKKKGDLLVSKLTED